MGRRPKVSRDEVLRTARAAFAERGFEGTTLAAIAARLDLSPAALLRHAPTKEALFAEAMRAGEGEIRPPVEFLVDLTGEEEPRAVLERLARAMVPFVEQKLDETVASWMRAKVRVEGVRDLRLPFDPGDRPTPPQRVLALLEEYLRRAVAAGRLRLADPRAAALAYLGSLHSYVMLHRMVRIFDPPLPFDRYLKTLLDLWMEGARPPAAAPPPGEAPAAHRPALTSGPRHHHAPAARSGRRPGDAPRTRRRPKEESS
jgi:TetR/AcrR family transcriptional regulator, mexJK operon transcriptional repressor